MHVLRAALDAMRDGRPAALCTVIGVDGSAPRASSARMLVYEDGDIVGTIGGGEWERRVIEAAVACIDARTHGRLKAHLTRDLGMCCGGAMEVYIENLASQDHVRLFGAGHVAGALAPLLRQLDFTVTVYDEREEWLTEARFPDCERVLGDPGRALPATEPGDFLIIVTHSHQLDQALLQGLLERPFRYLGMIGSRAKIAKFFVRLRAAGLDEAAFSRVCAPIGLDIGAETPAEIAVSIAAELVRVRRGHSAPTVAMSEIPLPARGGDGVATPPGLKAPTT
ncbi:MAG: xanthine dehydrogenase accessory protein XdhC [Alphaproteobacteria bacterium]|nr:xanthine dehydrogenase accessory protein XdhC [Alphaproteobacteria bacterium]